MKTAIICFLGFFAVNVVDIALYIWALRRGARFSSTVSWVRSALPLSGFRLAWKVARDKRDNE